MEESGISDEEMEEEWFVLFNTQLFFSFLFKALIKLYTHWYLITQLRRVLMRSIDSKQHYLIKIKSFISEWYQWSPPRLIKLIYAFSTEVPLSLQLCSNIWAVYCVFLYNLTSFNTSYLWKFQLCIWTFLVSLIETIKEWNKQVQVVQHGLCWGLNYKAKTH